MRRASTAAFAAAVVVAALGLWHAVGTRDAILREAETSVRILSRALAQHAARTVQSIDLVLMDAVEHREGAWDAAGLGNYMRSRAALLPQARNLVLLDADGDWVADAIASHGPLNSADRAFFLWHRDHADRGLHVDDAIIGRTSGKPGIPLSRRIDTPDGGFGGIVIATLSPDYFEAFYRTVTLHAHGTVALWRDDGTVLARTPSLPDGQRLPAAPVEEARLGFSAPAGLVRSASPFDGVERLFAFEHVPGYPLVASAAVSIDDALAEWKRQTLVEGLAVAVASLCLILLGAALVRQDSLRMIRP